VFILRLEHGDVVPDCIEHFAREKGVSTGYVILVGGIDSGKIVAGPRNSAARPLEPIFVPVNDAHDIAAVGVLAPDESGKPVLHIHGTMGRSVNTLSGCLRPGVTTWIIGEVILYEITDADVIRLKDTNSGFELLEIEP
ncbi:PPC domain-containing DNA-binding protein, partial [Chloroflexota bacterium]